VLCDAGNVAAGAGCRSRSIACRRVAPVPSHGGRGPADVASLVDGLEPVQRAAVLADDPVVCVLAGAGTGKTRVLTLRVARRIQDRSAQPGHVLVCTFSRKAAGELRDRLWALGVGPDVDAGTLHRAALRLIGQYCADHRLRTPAVLADRRTLLAAALSGLPSPREKSGRRPDPRPRYRRAQASTVGQLDAEIGWAKARLVAPEGYEAAALASGRRPSLGVGRVADLYAAYEGLRRARGGLDLDDLVWHCADLLDADAAFARAARWWHRHLFVDETQDLNGAQFRLLRLLVGDTPDLFVVGDPNQSIYGWNGADPSLLDRITDEFTGSRVFRLHANHRCTPEVVQAAAAVLDRPDGSQPPVSSRRGGPIPRIVRLATSDDEAAWVAREVWLSHRPGRRWSAIAVLARTNRQLDVLKNALEAQRVPCRLAGAELGPASDVVSGADRDGDEAATRDAPDAESDDGGDGPAASHEPAANDDLGWGEDAVVLSTFHRAKGLQWRTVFVAGVSDGLVPLVSARSRQAREEERRLLYVAMTRAEDELTCTWAAHRDAESLASGAAPRRPCPWLAPVERALEDLVTQSEAVADPAAAAEHLARMRQNLGTLIGAAKDPTTP
jgi:DNA helicase II / ATP-dependent DNA helicase PcrA